MKNTKATNGNVRFRPEGYSSVSPYLIAENADNLIEFIEQAFGGKVISNVRTDDDKVMHASIKIGDSVVMLADTMNDMGPETGTIFLYVEDVDSVYRAAVEAKGKSIQEPKDMFYGDRLSGVTDQWGNKWWIATHKEDVSDSEMEKRGKKEYASHSN